MGVLTGATHVTQGQYMMAVHDGQRLITCVLFKQHSLPVKALFRVNLQVDVLSRRYH